MAPTPQRIRSMRHVEAMVAPDTFDLLSARVSNLLAAGRRMSMTHRYTYSSRPPELTVGLTLDGEPETWRRDDGAGFFVRLKPGLTAGFGFSVYEHEVKSEAGAWARFRDAGGDLFVLAGLTRVEITGDLDNDGPARDDSLAISYWNSVGVCIEKVIGFDYDSGRTRGGHPEDICRRCGGPNVTWHAPSPLWNEVMRHGDINAADLWGGIICPTCFAMLVEAGNIASSFRLDATDVSRELTTVTPSGRVWNPETWLWEDES